MFSLEATGSFPKELNHRRKTFKTDIMALTVKSDNDINFY